MSGTENSGDTALEQVIARLEEWAEWYSRDQAGGLGYPRIAAEFRLKMSRSTTPPSLPFCEAAEEIEAWVCEMARQNPAMASALRSYYFYPGGLRQQAARLKIALSQFRLHLNMAQQWLVGRLVREEAGLNPKNKRN